MNDTSVTTIQAFDFGKLFASRPLPQLPVGPIMAQISEGVREVAKAQMELNFAILRTGFTIFEACFNRTDVPETADERPSIAARESWSATA